MSSKVLKDLSSIPLIVILGSTATGKSKLGIELAKKFHGEIISADSMQVYQGLDIITNKVTLEERAEAQHHLIDFLQPPNEFTVTTFQSKALEIIQDIAAKGSIPIVVGGTNYYIEALLWEFLITGKAEQTAASFESRKEMGGGKKRKLNEDEPTETLYEKLMRVDPERAEELHPNDVRKISRSLQIYETTNTKHSALLKKQKSAAGASHLGGPLRFTKSLVFWLTCEQNILDDRIAKRVNCMLDRGLVNEVSSFYQSYKDTYNKLEKDSDKNTCLYEEGLFQAIGFKEFHEFFTNEEDDEEKKKRLLNSGLETLKRNTIKYSKKQRTWVKNRFLSRNKESAPDVYELDATDLHAWHANVFEKAERITNAFLTNEEITEEPLERIQPDVSVHTKHVCSVCEGRIIIGDLNWTKHLTSRGHRRATKRKKKLDDEQ